MSTVLVCCPNPVCPGHSIEGETVNRAAWEATWHEAGRSPISDEYLAGEWDSNIECPECGHEGIDPESGQLNSAEEELGIRCECGIVSERFTELDKEGNEVVNPCPHCSKRDLPA